MNESVYPDEVSYEKIWNALIAPEINNYIKKKHGCVDRIPHAKSAIWNEYRRLNEYCKLNYMQNGKAARIDRHKVAACYMLAICTVRPLYFTVKELNDLTLPVAINETLAITVGLSLLRAFILSSLHTNTDCSSAEKKRLHDVFDGGIFIPSGDMVNHGDYIENYANELYYAVSDGKACILSVSHELYLLELLTRMGGLS